jgi:hypothetical protein
LYPTARDWLIAGLPAGKGLGMVGFRSGKDGRGAGCGAMRGNDDGLVRRRSAVFIGLFALVELAMLFACLAGAAANTAD